MNVMPLNLCDSAWPNSLNTPKSDSASSKPGQTANDVQRRRGQLCPSPGARCYSNQSLLLLLTLAMRADLFTDPPTVLHSYQVKI